MFETATVAFLMSLCLYVGAEFWSQAQLETLGEPSRDHKLSASFFVLLIILASFLVPVAVVIGSLMHEKSEPTLLGATIAATAFVVGLGVTMQMLHTKDFKINE